ncbi:MAG: hypothetical protein ACR2KZ_10560 [Segetibacter sp.]
MEKVPIFKTLTLLYPCRAIFIYKVSIINKFLFIVLAIGGQWLYEWNRRKANSASTSKKWWKEAIIYLI